MLLVPGRVDRAATLLPTEDAPRSSARVPVQPVLIRVDSAERAPTIPTLLTAFPDVTLSFAALAGPNYLFSNDVTVEGNTVRVFVTSILDRRLFGQTTRMKLLFHRARLINEGGLDQMQHRIDIEAIRGALAFLLVRAGITVLKVNDSTETAALLRITARYTQERMGQPLSLREPRPQIDGLVAANLVEDRQSVGLRRTRLLLAYVGPSTAISCAAEELTQLPGIFKTSAQRIWQAVHVQNRPDVPAP